MPDEPSRPPAAGNEPPAAAPPAAPAAKAAPARPAPPPPPELSERGQAIAVAVGDLLNSEPKADHNGSPMFEVPPDKLLDVARRLSCDFGYSYLSCLTTLEWPDRWETVYHLYDLGRKGTLVLKTSIPKDQDTFASVTAIWPAANWYEREAYDMYGVRFDGHPHLCRILMADDWQTYPLRKDHPMDLEGGY